MCDLETVYAKLGEAEGLLQQFPKTCVIERHESAHNVGVTVRNESGCVLITRSIPLSDNPFALMRLKALVCDLRGILQALDGQGTATLKRAG